MRPRSWVARVLEASFKIIPCPDYLLLLCRNRCGIDLVFSDNTDLRKLHCLTQWKRGRIVTRKQDELLELLMLRKRLLLRKRLSLQKRLLLRKWLSLREWLLLRKRSLWKWLIAAEAVTAEVVETVEFAMEMTKCSGTQCVRWIRIGLN